jgi:hypothetical protein
VSTYAQVAGVYTPPSNLPVDNYGPGASTVLNITAATLIKANPGRPVRIDVIIAGSAAGAAYDTNAAGSAAASNQIAAIPEYGRSALARPALPDWHHHIAGDRVDPHRSVLLMTIPTILIAGGSLLGAIGIGLWLIADWAERRFGKR